MTRLSPRPRAARGNLGDWKQRLREKLPPFLLRAGARVDRWLAAAAALPANRKILLAVVGSVLLHGVGIAAVVILSSLWPAGSLEARSLPPIRLTIERPDPTAEQSATQSSYVRTPDDFKSDHPPERPAFESDKDTLAATERPPIDPNATALPTQEGREVPVFEFDPRPYRPGEKAADAATAAAAPAAPTPARAVPPEKSVAKQRAKPASKPQNTPAPHEFAMLRPVPDPTPQPSPPEPNPGVTEPDPVATPRITRPPLPAARSAPPSVASAGPTVPPGYQQQTERVKINGGIDSRGRSSVAALGTPLGRYQKAMQDAIGSRWYYGIHQRIDLVNLGVVVVRFYITPEGRVQNPQILSGNNTGVLADVSLQAVMEARLPPMPPDVVSSVPSGRLEVTYRFERY